MLDRDCEVYTTSLKTNQSSLSELQVELHREHLRPLHFFLGSIALTLAVIFKVKPYYPIDLVDKFNLSNEYTSLELICHDSHKVSRS